jgi:hypothetical protein
VEHKSRVVERFQWLDVAFSVGATGAHRTRRATRPIQSMDCRVHSDKTARQHFVATLVDWSVRSELASASQPAKLWLLASTADTSGQLVEVDALEHQQLV